VLTVPDSDDTDCLKNSRPRRLRIDCDFRRTHAVIINDGPRRRSGLNRGAAPRPALDRPIKARYEDRPASGRYRPDEVVHDLPLWDLSAPGPPIDGHVWDVEFSLPV
jgi:hypothetical protein